MSLREKASIWLIRQSDRLIQAGSAMQTGEFIKDTRAISGIAIISMVIAAVIGLNFLAAAVPTGYVAWINATSAGGTMASASAGDKSIWNLGSLVIVGGSLLLVVGMFIKK